MKVPFIDLQLDYQGQKAQIDAAISSVLSGGRFILDKEVAEFEKEFAAFCHAPYSVGVASGTDALLLALKAFDIGPGDEVITVAHTAVATAAAIELSGATPVFVDVDPVKYTLDPALIKANITSNTRALIPVHIYGHPADMVAIIDIARANDLFVIEDNAQAHGALLAGKPVGSMGDAGAFSFYPTKNLGAFGDGGAVVCRNPDIVARLKELRQYGWRRRYVSEEIGFNSRLDELQAAILRVKLRRLHANNQRRRIIADLYAEQLKDCPLVLPQEESDCQHVYHLYVVQSEERDNLHAFLSKRGIGTAIHYPVPIHFQPAYGQYNYAPGSLPVTEQLALMILSLPMFPQLTNTQVTAVAETIRSFFGV